jgi:NAD-dependent SIR2 family protein deacetylase
MDVPEFLRLYQLRAPQIMWFLGAGASAAAGVPTAHHLTWDFKRSIYCAEQRISIRTCADIGDPSLQARIQQYFNSRGTFPPENSPDEYAFYFEAAYPNESDRRRVLDVHISAARPSYGHLALASLMKADKIRIVWTTNFDRPVEDAAAQVFGGTGNLTCATLDSAAIALSALNEGRWPLLGKLHGDFQSRRLKNTPEELRKQDVLLRDALIQSCQRNGVAVIGYSGRDESIVEALSTAMDARTSFPAGLFWFHRTDQPLLDGVRQLAAKAEARGISMHLLEVETFDELMADVVNLIPDLPAEITTALDKRLQRISNAPIPEPGKSWPLVRLNAFPIVEIPPLCRRVVCTIGGAKEVREAVVAAEAKIIATRRNVGVLAFGRDEDVRSTFESFKITEFDLHGLDARRLRNESMELGLLYDAIARALARTHPLIGHPGRRGHIMACDSTRADDDAFKPLRQAVGPINGIVPKTQIEWSEAFRFKLEHRLERLWLLLEPSVWIERFDDDASVDAVRDFRRERLAARYNKNWNALLDAWSHVFTRGADTAEIRAFGIQDGVDAVFRIGKVTAFSARQGEDRGR